MAYSTGTASSPVDMLQKIVAFLAANGWTTNMSQAEGTGWRAHMSKGGVFLNFRAANNENLAGIGAGYYLCFYVGTGYSGASAWNAQAGAPVQSGTSTVTGAAMAFAGSAGPYLTYDFFLDAADNGCLVLELAAGIFTHIWWGQVEKIGTWTGGTVFGASTSFTYASNTSVVVEGAGITASCPGAYGNYIGTAMGFVRADVDTFTSKWLSISSTTTASYGYTGKKCFSPVQGLNAPDTQIPGYGNAWQGRQTSDMNGSPNLLPVTLWAERDAGGASLLGQIPSIRFSNATTKGVAVRKEITIGSDTWKFFPGFAVRKV